MTDEKKPTIGLMLYRRRDNILGDTVNVVPVQWSDEYDRPIGVGMLFEFPHLQDLEFSGWVSDFIGSDSANEPAWPYYHGVEATYRPHTVDARRAKVMSDFLAKVQKAMDKASAREMGDRFAVFAKCIGAQYVWVAKGPEHTDTHRCVRYSVAEGKDRYRAIVAEARADTRKRLMPSRESV
jgi:hypothetical protein